MEQALAAVRRLPAVDGLVEQLLVRDDVAQPVGAEQQEVPRLELLLVQICPDALLSISLPTYVCTTLMLPDWKVWPKSCSTADSKE